jgi:GNAT superfamily N-acetyltransferase
MDYEITTDKSKLDLEVIHEFLKNSYWSPGIPRETLAKAMEQSLCFGVLQSGVLVGFARVISDYATFAYLADVFVLESHRGKGLSKRLMEAVIADPQLQGLRRFLLATRDAHGLYAQFGFKPLAAPPRFMEINRPDIYLT